MTDGRLIKGQTKENKRKSGSFMLKLYLQYLLTQKIGGE